MEEGQFPEQSSMAEKNEIWVIICREQGGYLPRRIWTPLKLRDPVLNCLIKIRYVSLDKLCPATAETLPVKYMENTLWALIRKEGGWLVWRLLLKVKQADSCLYEDSIRHVSPNTGHGWGGCVSLDSKQSYYRRDAFDNRWVVWEDTGYGLGFFRTNLIQ